MTFVVSRSGRRFYVRDGAEGPMLEVVTMPVQFKNKPKRELMLDDSLRVVDPGDPDDAPFFEHGVMVQKNGDLVHGFVEKTKKGLEFSEAEA